MLTLAKIKKITIIKESNFRLNGKCEKDFNKNSLIEKNANEFNGIKNTTNDFNYNEINVL